MPDKERLQLWVDALLGGQFKQARGTLKRGVKHERHCCLGVACEVFAQHSGRETSWVRKRDEDSDSMALHFCVGDHCDSGILPLPVAEWFGITQNPEVPTREGYLRVVGHLNDHCRATFAQIAQALTMQFNLDSANVEPS